MFSSCRVFFTLCIPKNIPAISLSTSSIILRCSLSSFISTKLGWLHTWNSVFNRPVIEQTSLLTMRVKNFLCPHLSEQSFMMGRRGMWIALNFSCWWSSEMRNCPLFLQVYATPFNHPLSVDINDCSPPYRFCSMTMRFFNMIF